MKRREFIVGLGGAAAWPVVTRAQQGERVRRIGLLSGVQENDTERKTQFAALAEGLQQLGWTEGRNLRIETRFGGGNALVMAAQAAELVALAPEVILAVGGVSMQALIRSATSAPIVFVQVLDPVGAGYVASLARPGSNVTGFTNFDYGIAGKWLEILKDIAPHVTRVAVIRDPAATSGTAQLAAIQSVAPHFGIDVQPVGLSNAREVERILSALAKDANGGLIVTAGAASTIHREFLFSQAVQHRLPAIYPYSHFVRSGGLIAYGPDTANQFNSAATYIDRILRGEKPAELPVQNPTKYELVINAKTAKALGLTIPATLLARADEVIE